MQPPKIQRLSREDFKDAPNWINRLLGWLNEFIEYVTTAMSKNVTFDENIQSQIKTFSVVAGAAADNTLSFMSILRVTPRGVLLMRAVDQVGNYTPVGAAVGIDWRYEGGSVFITSISGLTAGHTYEITVLVI